MSRAKSLLIFLGVSAVCVAAALFFIFSKPTTTNAESPDVIEPRVTTVQFFGDIMLDRNVAKRMGKRGLEYIFEHATGTPQFIGAADITIANLEGPFAVKRVKTSKSIAFRFDPAFAEQLKNYGFTAFDLANNHSYDMGKANVAFTRDTLKKAGLGYFGDELNEGRAYTWYKQDGFDTIAFIGIHNTYHEPDLKKVLAAITEAKTRAKYIFVMMHWGQEYQTISNTKQRTLAHWLIDHGATAVIGAHPHVVEEAEVYKGAPIFYSLGNFIFDQYFSKETQEGLSVTLSIRDGKVLSASLLPFYSVYSQVYAMQGARREAFLTWFGEHSRLGGAKLANGEITF